MILIDVNEDVDGDGNLDVYEDIDGDGKLDVYENLELSTHIPYSPEEALMYGEDALLIIDSLVNFHQVRDNPNYFHAEMDGDGNLDINEDIDGDRLIMAR